MPIDKNPGESKDDFISRCMSKEIEAGKEQDQAYAICITKYEEFGKTQSVTDNTWSTEAPISVELESYTDYPESAKNSAQRALDWADKNGWGSCGTPVGKARANQLAKGEPISKDTISRMASFARHLQYKDVPYSEGCGGLMVDAWGGQAGIEWAQTKLKELNMSEEVKLAKVSFDYDGTISTARGKELARRAIERGDTVYIISARSDKSGLLAVADELNIPYSRVYATGSNGAKALKIKELGIDTHIDNNRDVINVLPGVGQMFKAQRRVIFNEDFDETTVADYIEKGFKVHIRSSRKIQKRDRKVWNKLRAIGLTEDVMVFGEVKDLDKKYNYDLLMTGQDPILERLKLMGEDGSKYKILSSRRVDSIQEAFAAETELMKDVNLKFIRVVTRYTYEEIAGIPAAKSGSRPFCAQLRSTPNKMYSLEEIDSLSTRHLTDMGLPADVLQYRGGFYRNPDTGVTTAGCRHFWRVNVVVEQ